MGEQRTFGGERFSLALMLPQALRVTMVTTIGSFGLIILGVLGSMRYSKPPLNPFAAYADIMPGQPTNALYTHGFSCPTQDYSYRYDMADQHCVLRLETGDFSRIEVVYKHGMIHMLQFDIREGTISVGEIAAMLDLSAIRVRENVLFMWHGHPSKAKLSNTAVHFSAFRIVVAVVLTDSDP